ncbi:hypothetical protein B0H21DRAFT_727646 [Amylocystis lapponica]|nr:hypothetical protein B0H21DRAFT_727646 [Amylocystis lapponica]
MSESKLKALKVVDLKDLLTKAAVPIPSKANKQDLIAKVLASPAALQVYHQQHPSPSARQNKKQTSPKHASPKQSSSPTPEIDELLDSPEPSEYGSNNATVAKIPPSASATAPIPTPAIDTKPVPVLPPVSDTSETISTATDDPPPPPEQQSSGTVDEELEKRKARAARFSIPLVEPVPPKAPAKTRVTQPDKKAKISAQPVSDSPEKLNARANRFGLDLAPPTLATTPVNSKAESNGRKRAAPPIEAVDAEELERRRKRAERFGPANVSTKP